jgi:hypothetical protein
MGKARGSRPRARSPPEGRGRIGPKQRRRGVKEAEAAAERAGGGQRLREGTSAGGTQPLA